MLSCTIPTRFLTHSFSNRRTDWICQNSEKYIQTFLKRTHTYAIMHTFVCALTLCARRMYYTAHYKWSVVSAGDWYPKKMHSLCALHLFAIRQIGYYGIRIDVNHFAAHFPPPPPSWFTGFVWPLTRLCVCNRDWSVEWRAMKFMRRPPPLTLRSVNTRRFTYGRDNAITSERVCIPFGEKTLCILLWPS